MRKRVEGFGAYIVDDNLEVVELRGRSFVVVWVCGVAGLNFLQVGEDFIVCEYGGLGF